MVATVVYTRLFVGHGTLSDVRFYSDDRLDFSLLTGLVELYSPVQVAVVSQSQCGHAKLFSPSHHFGYFTHAIEEGVMAVGVEVDVAHVGRV